MSFSWGDVGKLIGNAAPIVGTAIGGPAGTAIGSLVAGLLGVDNNPDAVANAIKADPSIAVKIEELKLKAHELDLEAVTKSKQAEIDELTVRITDIQNARSRQIEHEKATGKSDINLYVLAWLTVLGFFILIGILLWAPLPKGSENIVYLLLGCLTANTNSVYQYFFGSSKGSADKTVELTKIAKVN